MSADAGTTYVEGSRPFTITHDDHRGVVVAVAAVFIIYAYMIIGMRLAARIRTMGLDDYLAILATVLATVQLSIVIGAASHQLGASFSHYTGDDGTVVAKLVRASDVFLCVSLFVVKAAVIWLCRRLFSVNQKASRLVCDVALAVSAISCLASILIITIGCDDQAAIGFQNEGCSGLLNRWIIVGVFDGAIEILILSLSIIVVWPLRMSLSRRLSAISCFLFRLPILLFIGLHLHYLSRFTHDSNKGVGITRPIVFRQAELLFSLFSAAIPALNQYLRKFQTTGAATFGYNPGSYGGHSYGLKSLSDRSRNPSHTTDTDTSGAKDKFAPPSTQGKYQATIEYGYSKDSRNEDNQDEHSLDRQNSDDMIIRKDVAYEVAYSDAESRPRDPISSVQRPPG